MICNPLHIMKVIGSRRISSVGHIAFFEDMRNANLCGNLPVHSPGIQ